MALAFSAGALVHHEGVVSAGKGALDARAQVPFRRTAIAVKHYFDRGVRVGLVILGKQGQAVHRANFKNLVGQFADVKNILRYLFFKSAVNRQVGQMHFFLAVRTAFVGGVKGRPKAKISQSEQ